MRHHLILVVLLAGCSGTVVPAECPDTGPVPEYNRDTWGRWIDADGDCQDTRQEVLIRDSEVEVAFEDEKQCRVASGRWTDPLTGSVITNPSSVDIDHTVALKDAHESGGYAWSDDLKLDFSNNLENPAQLRATSRTGNRSKGDRGPDEWLPPNEGHRCQYVRDWKAVKANYDLSMTPAEAAVVAYILAVCDRGEIPALPQG